MFSAGFYYKTFMWPKAAWKRYKPKIRAAAGLGSRPTNPIPTTIRRVCPLRSAGTRGRRRRHRRGARGRRPACMSSSPTSRRNSVVRCVSRAALSIDGQDGFVWAQAGIAKLAAMDHVRSAAAHDRLRLLRAEFRRTHRARHGPSRRSRQRPAARAPVAGALEEKWCSPPAPSSGKWCLPTTTGRA